jgi:hypothetical protein
VLRYCEPGRHYVLDGDAQVLRIEATGPTTGRRVYACHEHVRAGGLLPVAAAAAATREDA